MDAKSKSYTIWMMKIVATFLVVFIHSANIFRYANSFMPSVLTPFSMLANTGVPIFMVVSGYLFFLTQKDWKQNFIKKVKRLALPFFIWSCFWVGVEALGHIVLPGQFENVFGWSPAEIGGVL